jgi:hypothetical protein
MPASRSSASSRSGTSPDRQRSCDGLGPARRPGQQPRARPSGAGSSAGLVARQGVHDGVEERPQQRLEGRHTVPSPGAAHGRRRQRPSAMRSASARLGGCSSSSARHTPWTVVSGGNARTSVGAMWWLSDQVLGQPGGQRTRRSGCRGPGARPAACAPGPRAAPAAPPRSPPAPPATSTRCATCRRRARRPRRCPAARRGSRAQRRRRPPRRRRHRRGTPRRARPRAGRGRARR